MTQQRFPHIHEQVTQYLREELYSGRWTTVMPGRNQLVKLLEVSGKTVDLALQQLESEGLLKAQGVGKKRRIVLPEGKIKPPVLRICIFTYEGTKARNEYELDLKHRLDEAGHVAYISDKSLIGLGMNVERIARYVKQNPADVWVVCSGSYEVLEWFSQQPMPVYALFGRRSGLPIAGGSPRKIPTMENLVDELVSLGHERIVLMVREERKYPYPALFEQAFLDRLWHHGIEAGDYNLPTWKDDKRDFHQCLDRIFQVTPPTAMIVGEGALMLSTIQHLSRLGIHAPDQISLISADPEPSFYWCDPIITHMSWDPAPLMRRVVQWAQHVAQGRQDLKQTTYSAHLVRGGTIGPAPKLNR